MGGARSSASDTATSTSDADNRCIKPLLILGINMFHSDASAALLVDGNVEIAIGEERLNRVKHFGGVPLMAIQACLDHAGVTLADVEHVAVGRDPRVHLERKLWYGAKHPRMLANLTRMRLTGVSRFNDLRPALADAFDIDPEKLRFRQHNVEHHLAHIASAFYCSDKTAAAGFSYDGSGDWVTCMWADCRDTEIKIVDRTFVPHSLGTFYSMISQFIGYTEYGDEGKVMGLAALGDESLYEQVARIIRPYRGSFRADLSYFMPTGSTHGVEIGEDGRVTHPPLYSDKMTGAFGAPRRRHAEITDRDKNLAFALQRRFEEITLEILRNLHRLVPRDALVMAGGCALNSVVNGRVLEETPFEATWIQPAAGDEGLSVGAALYCYHSVLGRPRSYEMTNAYLGPSFSDAQIESELGRQGLRFRKVDTNELVETTAERIESGAIVGWFQDRMEWGPRALGNRSILTHPGLPEIKDVLNSRIKHREWFRPFAPSILAEHLDDYFDAPEPSPFMLHAFKVKPNKKEELQAVVHVDDTGRIQTVARSENPLYHSLIEAFRRRTGTPVLLNTSFNENEPIVCSPKDAIDCFVRTKMDLLAVGPFLVERG